jgi:hypothetical protein
MTRSTVVRKVGIAAAVALAVVGGMAALGGSGDGGIDATTASVDKAAPSTTVAGRSRASVEAASGAGGTASADTDTYAATAAPAPLAPDVASSDAAAETSSGKGVADSAMVVKTGSLSLDIEEGAYDRTVEVLTTKAAGAGGYVAESTTSRSGDQPSGTLVLRVPTPAFDGLLADARKLGEVVDESSQGTDVSGEHTDLQARLTALAATRDKLTLILSKAATVEETLSVQDRITGVQTQIEQLQGQLKVLGSRSSMSTLTVTVDQKAVATTVPGEKSGIHKAFDRSVDRFVNGVEAIVAGTGPVLLAIIVIAALWLGGRFGYRVLRRNMV